MRFHEGSLKWEDASSYGASLRRVTVDVDNCLGERLRRFLGEIVANATRDDTMGVFAREFLGINAAVDMWRAIGIAFERNGWYGDDRAFGQLLFEIVIP